MCVKGDPLLLTNGVAFFNSLAEKYLDADANKALQEALVQDKQAKLELEMVDSKILANLMRKEHPQTISLIMAYTESRKSAEVLSQLPVEVQVEVCLRMASLDTVTPQTLKAVESALLSELKGFLDLEAQETSGVVLVAEILNAIEKSHEERIFEQLMEIDPELAEEIRITCLSSTTSSTSMTVAFRRSYGRLITRCFGSQDRRRSRFRARYLATYLSVLRRCLWRIWRSWGQRNSAKLRRHRRKSPNWLFNSSPKARSRLPAQARTMNWFKNREGTRSMGIIRKEKRRGSYVIRFGEEVDWTSGSDCVARR